MKTMSLNGRELGKVHIGTSGWHYKHWLGPFYPPKMPPSKMLRFYVERFDTVEINNSFYRLPAVTAIQAWCRETPPGFCFAVKASRYITHNRKLNDPKETVEKFMEVLESSSAVSDPFCFNFRPAGNLTSRGSKNFSPACRSGIAMSSNSEILLGTSPKCSRYCTVTMRPTAFTNLPDFSLRSRSQRTLPTFACTVREPTNIRGTTQIGRAHV